MKVDQGSGQNQHHKTPMKSVPIDSKQTTCEIEIVMEVRITWYKNPNYGH